MSTTTQRPAPVVRQQRLALNWRAPAAADPGRQPAGVAPANVLFTPTPAEESHAMAETEGSTTNPEVKAIKLIQLPAAAAMPAAEDVIPVAPVTPADGATAADEDERRPVLKLTRAGNATATPAAAAPAPAAADVPRPHQEPLPLAAAATPGLGGQLKHARELRGLTIARVAEDTRINADYIAALEEERFAALPLAAIYVKSYLKTLARRYGLNPDALIAEYERRTSAAAAPATPAAAATPAPAAAKPAAAAAAAKAAGPLQLRSKATKKTPATQPQAALPEGRGLKRHSLAMAAVVALVLAVLACAGIKAKFFSGGDITREDLATLSEQELRGLAAPAALPFTEMSIPRKHHAADARH